MAIKNTLKIFFLLSILTLTTLSLIFRLSYNLFGLLLIIGFILFGFIGIKSLFKEKKWSIDYLLVLFSTYIFYLFYLFLNFNAKGLIYNLGVISGLVGIIVLLSSKNSCCGCNAQKNNQKKIKSKVSEKKVILAKEEKAKKKVTKKKAKKTKKKATKKKVKKTE
jgi:membrane-bound ClpP family serine protease